MDEDGTLGPTQLAEPIKATKYGRRRDQMANKTPQKAERVGGDDSSSGDDIPEIPDLDDQELSEEEDLTRQVADAPAVHVNKVQTLSELQAELKYTVKDDQAEGVDMGLLTSVLAPQAMVAEQDVNWDYEALFSECRAELTAQMDASRATGKA